MYHLLYFLLNSHFRDLFFIHACILSFWKGINVMIYIKYAKMLAFNVTTFLILQVTCIFPSHLCTVTANIIQLLYIFIIFFSQFDLHWLLFYFRYVIRRGGKAHACLTHFLFLHSVIVIVCQKNAIFRKMVNPHQVLPLCSLNHLVKRDPKTVFPPALKLKAVVIYCF